MNLFTRHPAEDIDILEWSECEKTRLSDIEELIRMGAQLHHYLKALVHIQHFTWVQTTIRNNALERVGGRDCHSVYKLQAKKKIEVPKLDILKIL